jgi:hypothetical protein
VRLPGELTVDTTLDRADDADAERGETGDDLDAQRGVRLARCGRRADRILLGGTVSGRNDGCP